MNGLSAAGLADLAGVTELEVARWAVRSTRTYRQVSQETGVPLDTLGAVLESMGFARVGPDEPMREDELAVVPLLQLGLSSGTFDLAWLTRLGRAHADGLRLLATSWTEAYQARFEGLALESGADERTAMELAAQLGGDFLPLADPALLGIYRRQQELAWTEHLVERIENELETAGVLAETLAMLVTRSSREHGGVPVKWLGDGVMIHHQEPAGAVLSALGLVAQLPAAGLPPAHVGVAAGPVVAQGGDYFGRTVNLAARIAAHAGAGQVLVSASVANSAPPQGVRFVEQGELPLKGFARPVRLLEACRA
jgi:adenylate cyclase